MPRVIVLKPYQVVDDDGTVYLPGDLAIVSDDKAKEWSAAGWVVAQSPARMKVIRAAADTG